MVRSSPFSVTSVFRKNDVSLENTPRGHKRPDKVGRERSPLIRASGQILRRKRGVVHAPHPAPRIIRAAFVAAQNAAAIARAYEAQHPQRPISYGVQQACWRDASPAFIAGDSGIAKRAQIQIFRIGPSLAPLHLERMLFSAQKQPTTLPTIREVTRDRRLSM